MTVLTIRDLDPEVETRLVTDAARNGRSKEAEARAILTKHLTGATVGDSIATQIRAALTATGGVDLDLPDRATTARQVDSAF